jgi:hypothetical protein
VADFHIDQNTPPSLAPELRRLGHTALTARDLGMRQARDAEHLLHAAQHGRIVITRDKDFLELQIAWLRWPVAWGLSPSPSHAGILVIPSVWPVPYAAQEIDAFLQGMAGVTNLLYEYMVGQGWQQFP